VFESFGLLAACQIEHPVFTSRPYWLRYTSPL